MMARDSDGTQHALSARILSLQEDTKRIEYIGLTHLVSKHCKTFVSRDVRLFVPVMSHVHGRRTQIKGTRA